jgi:ABC-type multidrug transport system permease subunit
LNIFWKMMLYYLLLTIYFIFFLLTILLINDDFDVWSAYSSNDTWILRVQGVIIKRSEGQLY